MELIDDIYKKNYWGGGGVIMGYFLSFFIKDSSEGSYFIMLANGGNPLPPVRFLNSLLFA